MCYSKRYNLLFFKRVDGFTVDLTVVVIKKCEHCKKQQNMKAKLIPTQPEFVSDILFIRDVANNQEGRGELSWLMLTRLEVVVIDNWLWESKMKRWRPITEYV
jgi:hypothetical protein